MRLRQFALLPICAIALMAPGAFAGAAEASSSAVVAPPASSATDASLAQAFLAALGESAATRAAFVESRVSPAPFMPKDRFAPVIEQLAAMKLTPAPWTRRGRWLIVPVTDDKGRYARIRLDVDRADPTRIKGIVPGPWPRPYDQPLPAGPMSRTELAAAIDRRVRFAADRDDLSGAVMVVRGDQVIYAGAFGQADRDHATPNTLDTRFHLGSMDKQFTAVAIGQLIEQGRLSLDTRLIEVLPDYPGKDAAAKITIRHLLTHTAGLGGMFEREAYQRDRHKPFDRVTELLPMFATEPLQFEPGKGAEYSNEGFIVLGAVIEKVSGESWFDYVRRHIFEPAGMTATGSPTLEEVAEGRAVGYRFADDDLLGFKARRPNWTFLGYRGNSCGGGYSTARDMIAFLKALRGGKLLKPETVELFTTEYAGGIGGYGMGFERTSQGARTVRGHDGGGANSGINSDAKVIWETGYAYAVMGNYDAPFAEIVGDDIATMLAAQD